MKQILILLLLSTLYQTATAQDSLNTFTLRGIIYTEKDSSLMSGVHVINISTLKGVVSDENGEFSITVSNNQRILFSYLGFEVDTIRINPEIHRDLKLKIKLKETSYLLSIFSILSIETFEEFEKKFLALDLPDEELNFKFPTPEYQPYLPDNQAFTISIPFDLSYFSKKAKDYRKYRAMLEKDTYEELIHERYNSSIVEKVTGIKNEEKIKSLMQYCDFSDQFILNSQDYDLYVAIIKCSESFEIKNKSEITEKSKKTKEKEE